MSLEKCLFLAMCFAVCFAAKDGFEFIIGERSLQLDGMNQVVIPVSKIDMVEFNRIPDHDTCGEHMYRVAIYRGPLKTEFTTSEENKEKIRLIFNTQIKMNADVRPQGTVTK